MKIKRIAPNESLVRPITQRHRERRRHEREQRAEAEAERIMKMLLGREAYLASLPLHRRP